MKKLVLDDLRMLNYTSIFHFPLGFNSSAFPFQLDLSSNSSKSRSLTFTQKKNNANNRVRTAETAVSKSIQTLVGEPKVFLTSDEMFFFCQRGKVLISIE